MNTLFTTSALKNRRLVYTFIDKSEKRDANLFNYFKFGQNNLPQLVLFDFDNRYHHIQASDNIDELLNKYYTGKVEWSTGSYFEDILLKMGLKLDQTFIAYFLGIAFVVLLGIMITLVCFCGESSADDEEDRKQEEQSGQGEQAGKQDLKTKKEQ
jgi:hypothetical protein